MTKDELKRVRLLNKELKQMQEYIGHLERHLEYERGNVDACRSWAKYYQDLWSGRDPFWVGRKPFINTFPKTKRTL